MKWHDYSKMMTKWLISLMMHEQHLNWYVENPDDQYHCCCCRCYYDVWSNWVVVEVVVQQVDYNYMGNVRQLYHDDKWDDLDVLVMVFSLMMTGHDDYYQKNYRLMISSYVLASVAFVDDDWWRNSKRQQQLLQLPQ